MACARIHDSQTCCDASGLSHKLAEPRTAPILSSAPLGGESEGMCAIRLDLLAGVLIFRRKGPNLPCSQ